jgi:GH15 family glucan-1,4-alpha-glucosidase
MQPAPAPRLDHGLVGNGRVLALVAPTGSVDWMCLPRFDSPSVFARILDEDHGGSFRILHGDHEIRGDMAYLPNTNVLRTVFAAGDARWEVLDFAPRVPRGLDVDVPLQFIRVVRPIRGTPRLRVVFDPRPEYARVTPQLLETTHGVAVLGGAAPLYLHTNVPVPYVLGGRAFLLDRTTWFVVGWGAPEGPMSVTGVLDVLDMTTRGWRRWASTCALPTFAPAEVLRSALCLKLCAYHDTGAIIAAATTSIPEAMGTERTWDYRYCWLRDAAFVVEALRRLGHVDEGAHFLRYLRDVAEAGPLQPLYGIGGERDLEERFLPHLAGYGGNGFVRVGNAASTQRQNDLMGEMILCLETLLGDPRTVHEDPARLLPLIERLVEEAIAAAPTPDTSIWEFRSFLRPYTFSRAMCWAAIHRGARLAARLGRKDLAERWEAVAVQERATVLRRGWNPDGGFFAQALDGVLPDASSLLLATIGLVDAHDPRFRATVDACGRLLVDRGFMLRYRNDDDFGAVTSAFTICSFWWAEALALCGRLDEAAEVFHRICAHANPVGLFSEDVDPATGRLLGNFPQAYTHVGLIHAAMTIGQLLEARDGAVRAWR